jgi:hypothetical protein
MPLIKPLRQPSKTSLQYDGSSQAFAYPGSSIVRPSVQGLPVEYKQFTISAYEREPGKWRARVRRTSGRALIAGRARLLEFVTARDSSSEARAMTMAIDAIDAGAFSRATKRSSEKFWRRTVGRKDRAE